MRGRTAHTVDYTKKRVHKIWRESAVVCAASPDALRSSKIKLTYRRQRSPAGRGTRCSRQALTGTRIQTPALPQVQEVIIVEVKCGVRSDRSATQN